VDIVHLTRYNYKPLRAQDAMQRPPFVYEDAMTA